MAGLDPRDGGTLHLCEGDRLGDVDAGEGWVRSLLVGVCQRGGSLLARRTSVWVEGWRSEVGSRPYHVPERVPVSSIFIDESGSKNSRGGFFVLGFIKSRDTPALVREVRGIRQKHHYHDEVKFASVRRDSLPFFNDLAELIGASNLRVGGSVYDSRAAFQGEYPTWRKQATMSKRLVIGNINKGELVNIFLDLVSTPRGESVAATVQQEVNDHLGGRSVVGAYDMDSKSHDALQLADLLAGAICYERRQGSGETADPPGGGSPKSQLVRRLRRALDLPSFVDVSCGKVNILTMRNSAVGK